LIIFYFIQLDMLNNLTIICLIYFFGVSVKYKLFFNTHIRIGDATFKLSEIWTSMEYHLEVTKEAIVLIFFLFFLGVEGIIS
jgi:hypothetical protein